MPESSSESKFSPAESVQTVAQGLIPNYHPELAQARIHYLFTQKAAKKGGRELCGKAAKVSGRWEYLTELDFVIEVALPIWNDATASQRQAIVDHLLEHCTAEEDEQSGDFKWLIREPDVREFASILERHGAWHEGLVNLCTVAQRVDLSGIVDEELGDEIEQDLTTEEELSGS